MVRFDGPIRTGRIIAKIEKKVSLHPYHHVKRVHTLITLIVFCRPESHAKRPSTRVVSVLRSDDCWDFPHCLGWGMVICGSRWWAARAMGNLWVCEEVDSDECWWPPCARVGSFSRASSWSGEGVFIVEVSDWGFVNGVCCGGCACVWSECARPLVIGRHVFWSMDKLKLWSGWRKVPILLSVSDFYQKYFKIFRYL